MRSGSAAATTAALATAGGALGFVGLMAVGRLTLDLGWGRSFHQLGPLELPVAAPRELVYQQLASPYLGATPRGMRHRLQVLDRGADLVVARHVSSVKLLGRPAYEAATVESVGFEEPRRITFRHLRGPVPHAEEEFVLDETDGATLLTYRGELGIDFWALGRLAGTHWVVPEWMDVVEQHLHQVKADVEARAAHRAARAGGGVAGNGEQPEPD